MSDTGNLSAATAEQAMTEKLGKIRNKIDSIDTQILQLLSERANCAEEVAVTKRAAGEQDIKFYRPERWSKAQILEEHSFAFELADAEVPVVAPIQRNGESLFEHNGYTKP